MTFEASHLSAEFAKALGKIGGVLVQPIEHITWPAPHRAKSMPNGASAVYVFYLPRQDQSDRVLKVGKAGPASGPRYFSHHYHFSAPSTLAKAILFNPILWGEIGLDSIRKEDVGEWRRQNTSRMNFHLYGEDRKWVSHLEIFLRGKLAPMMEGVQTKEVMV
ncbi:MAG: hypothetical protein AAF727_02305 [Pseudomonadota bacterium]